MDFPRSGIRFIKNIASSRSLPERRTIESGGGRKNQIQGTFLNLCRPRQKLFGYLFDLRPRRPYGSGRVRDISCGHDHGLESKVTASHDDGDRKFEKAIPVIPPTAIDIESIADLWKPA
ncbi:hypothetical protein LG047_13170 [Methylocystis sp. WRRC1]|uniref:hypothetical protein n=1 Tax=Methylocystis sp. WRRC1 TaxID=1732014 RepID=UPI001D144DE7|nr:hypothetical protein [Methylocystis sp. WRRC1]MCC3246259.1 hypothetical protein [Methylocystis sp. WRRC1]